MQGLLRTWPEGELRGHMSASREQANMETDLDIGVGLRVPVAYADIAFDDGVKQFTRERV